MAILFFHMQDMGFQTCQKCLGRSPSCNSGGNQTLSAEQMMSCMEIKNGAIIETVKNVVVSLFLMYHLLFSLFFFPLQIYMLVKCHSNAVRRAQLLDLLSSEEKEEKVALR